MAASTNRITNISTASIGGVDLTNPKSLTWTETETPLESQANGRRQPEIVGTLGRSITAELECEDGGALPDVLGIENAGSLVVTFQQDSDSSTLTTCTMTNMYIEERGGSSDQGAPNSLTYSFRSVSEVSTISYS